MTELLQYPVQAAIDPLALAETDAASDELRWFRELSQPAYRPAPPSLGWVARYPGVIQEAWPAADVSGDWTPSQAGASLASMIDEVTADDSDFIRSPERPANNSQIVTINAVTDPGQHDEHVVHYRYRKEPPDGPRVDLTVTLRQGSTLIASWTHADIPGDAVRMAHQALSVAEAAAITDYSALRLEFTADQP